MAKRSIAEFHARADLDASQFEKGAQGMASSMSDTVQQIEKSLGMLDMAAVKSAQRTASVFGKEGIGPIDVSGAEKSLLAGQEAAAQRRMELNDQISQSMTRRVSEEMRAFTALAQAQSASNSLLADQLRQEEAASQRRIQLTRGVMTARIQSIQNASEYERGVERSVALMREANAQEAIKDQQRLTDAISRTAAIQNQLNANIGISTSLARFDPSQSAFNDLPANFASLAPKAQQAAYAVSSVNTQLRKSRVGMMDFGVITQQAGYQVQDFAVQVAGGQSALVALAQQGSQMLGFFGPAGAIAGAVLGVGVLASRLMDTAAQMKAAKEEADKLASSFERLRDARVSRAMSGADFQKQQQILTGEVSKAQKELAAIEAQAAHQSSMVAGASAQPRGGNVFVYENAESQRKAQEEIDAFWERNKGRTFLLGAENAHIESIAAKHGGVIKSAREAADDAAEALDGLMAPLNAARDKYEELAHQLKKIQEEHARAFEAQKTANAEAAMTSTERQADIQRQIDLLKKKGETETAEYAKLVGQQEAYARAFEAQKTANAEAAMTGTERQADIQRQIDLLKEKGQTETAEYAKLVGQQEEYARSLQQITTENSRFGESGLTTLNRLRDEMSKLDKDTIEYQEKLKQGQSIWAGYVAKADAIKDKQDPMRAIEREAKSIGELRREDLLTPEEAARAADDLIKSPEIPSALRTNAGASSLGGTAVNGSQVMDVAKSTLEEVKKLVEEARKQTRMWAGAN